MPKVVTLIDGSSNVIYENGTAKRLLTDEGYVDLTTNTYYYYLKDHQGNNRVVINSSGSVVETNHYYPFGGLFATNGSVQDYKYNGKEWDDKTKWYDYGARHYDAALGRFTTMDPLGEKVSAWTPFGYCESNPINKIDPTGMASRYNWDTKRYEDEEGNEVSWETVKEEYGIDDNRSSNKGQKEITPWIVGLEWVTGMGPRNRTFTTGDRFTELLREHEHIKNVKEEIRKAIKEKRSINKSFPYSLSGFQGIGKYLKDYSTLFTLGYTGNIAVTYLGSYNLVWRLISLDRSKGEAVVEFVVNNSSTIESGTRPPILGYTDFWQQHVGTKLNNTFNSGPMSKTTQTFIWTEKLNF